MDAAPSPWLTEKLTGLVNGITASGSADQEQSPVAGVRANVMEHRENVHKAATQLGRKVSTRISAARAPATADENQSGNDAPQGNAPGILGGLMQRRQDFHNAALQVGQNIGARVKTAVAQADNSPLAQGMSSARSHLNGAAGVMRKASTQTLNKGSQGPSVDSETEAEEEAPVMETPKIAAPKRKLSVSARKGSKPIEQQ